MKNTAKSNTQKLVSVIVRTKNRPETLIYALKSIIKQSYQTIEVILINEGEVFSQETLEFIRLSKHTMTLIENSQSKGRCKAGNQGLLACQGDYIIFLDDDDWFLPEHIHSLVNALEEQPEYLVAYSNVIFTHSPESDAIHTFNRPYDPIYLMLENTIPIHALLFSRTLLDKGCQLDDTLSVFEDWDLWLQFSQYTSFFHIDTISAGYRSSGDSNAGWGMDDTIVKKNRLKLVSKWQQLWTTEQLDQALHLGQNMLDNAFTACQDEKGKIMKDHKILHQAHQALDSACNKLSSAHEKLATTHGDLIDNHQDLEHVHSQLISNHHLLEKEHHQLISTHQTLEKINQSNTYEREQLQRIFIKSQQQLRFFEHEYPQLKEAYQQEKYHHTLLQEEFNAVINSSFWRYTAPFRSLTNILRHTLNSISTLVHRDKTVTHPIVCDSCHAKVGIMFHIYYTELFSPICQYLNNIPVPYQLLISVTNEKDELTIEKNLSLLNNNAQVIIKQVPNKGRDIAPLIVSFKEEIQALDIIAHIHTKKSRYTGNNDLGKQWLNYLLSQLLGNASDICQILTTLSSDSDIGIIYPDTYSDIPYWAHTWLSNQHQGRELLNKMGVHHQDYSQYIDFPAGSMFWAKSTALQPLFDLQLTMDDFPEELGQTDNTIHHAIERCFVFSSQIAGYQKRFISAQENHFELSAQSHFVFDQYISMSPSNRIIGSSQTADVISFDIFDTLFIRPFASPDAVFWWLEEKVKKQFNLIDFMHKRKSSEALLRQNLEPNKDVCISDIYQQMAKTYALDSQVIQQLQALEVTTEQTILQPRRHLSTAIKTLKKNNKRLILISDMYLETEHLQVLIDHYFPNVFSHLYVSSDVGHRKDRGDIWDFIVNSEKVTKEKLLHIGDNEHSDIQIPVDTGFHNPVHLMRPIAFLGCMQGGREIMNVFRQQKNWQNELMLGLIANKTLSYYEHAKTNQTPIFSQPKEFGYCLMGPIFFTFILWLIKQSKNDQSDQLLFLSRDGWLLEQLYNTIQSHPKIKKPSIAQGNYFYCSRSFIGLASMTNKEDFSLLLTPHYKGTLKKLLHSRFGLQDLSAFIKLFGKDVLDREVRLPHDRDEIDQYLSIIYPSIQAQADSDKALFLDYWQQQVANAKQPAIVDIGYSGTLQKAMIKLTGQGLKGYYFVTNESAKQIITLGGQCHSCFGHLLPFDQMNDLTIHRYSLLLEAIMTSPEGQLKRFKRSAHHIAPEFKEKGLSQTHFDTINAIHQGILKYTSDMIDVLGDEVFDVTLDKHQITELMSLIVNKKVNIGDLTHSLSVEDEFSGNSEINILDFYAQKTEDKPLSS